MFYTELSHYSPQEQQMYLDVLYFADINYEYHWTVYMPAFMNIGETYFFPAYQTSTNMPITAWFISMIDNYNEYTFQMGEYQRQIDFYSEQLRYQDEKAMWLFIDEFFDDPDNHLLVKEVALILLEEIESLIMYEDTDTYNLVIGLMTGSIDPSTLDLSPAGILAFVNAGQDFLNHLFSSMDETDKSTVLQLLNKAVYFYLNTLGMSPEDTEAMYLTIQPKVSAYFYSIFDIKQLVVDFMDTLTVEKIDTVIAAINILDSLPEDYEEGEESLELNDDLVRAIYISTIIDTLLASDALDTDYLIELVIYGYFDISYGFNYTGGVVIDDLVLELQTLIDAIIAQTDIVENYRIHINEEFLTVLYDDPMTSEIIEGMTESDIYEIETLKDLIDQLGYFIENGPEGYLPTV